MPSLENSNSAKSRVSHQQFNVTKAKKEFFDKLNAVSGSDKENMLYDAGKEVVKRINENDSNKAKEKAKGIEKEIKKLEQEVGQRDHESVQLIQEADKLQHLIQGENMYAEEQRPLFDSYQRVHEAVQSDPELKEAVAEKTEKKKKALAASTNQQFFHDLTQQKPEDVLQAFQQRYEQVLIPTGKVKSDEYRQAIKDDISQALQHPTIQDALKQLKSDKPLSDEQRQAASRALEKGFQDGLQDAVQRKTVRKETNRRFLNTAESILSTHYEAIEAVDNYEELKESADETFTEQLKHLKAAHPEIAPAINRLGTPHELNLTTINDGDASKITEYHEQRQARQKQAIDVANRRLNEEGVTQEVLHTETTNALDEREHFDEHKNNDKELLHFLERNINDKYNSDIDDMKRQIGVLERSLEKNRKQHLLKKKEVKRESAELKERKKELRQLTEGRDAALAEAKRICPLADFDERHQRFESALQDFDKQVKQHGEDITKKLAEIQKLKEKLETQEHKAKTKIADHSGLKDEAYNKKVAQQKVVEEKKKVYEQAKAQEEELKGLWEKSKEEVEAFDRQRPALELQLTIQKDNLGKVKKRIARIGDDSTQAARKEGLEAEAEHLETEIERTERQITDKMPLIEKAEQDRDTHYKAYRDQFTVRSVAEKELRDAEAGLEKYQAEYTQAKERYDSDERKRERYEDKLREEYRLELAFKRLQEIQRQNNRQMIWASALGGLNNAIKGHTLGVLNSMLTSLQKSN